MRSQSVARQTQPNQFLRLFLLATLVVIGTLLSQVAAAANDNLFDCDRLAADLKSLEVPAAELPLEGSKHLDGDENTLAVLDGDAAASAVESFATPVLLLTPRVASIMREVFGALSIPSANSKTDEESAPASPVVQAPQEPPRAVFPGGGTDMEPGNDHFIPRFQRQMYRTDI